MELPIMYHGSDLRIISMTREGRVDYKKKALSLAGYLWPYYSQCMELGPFYQDLKARVSNDLGEHFWISFYNALCCFCGFLNNNQLYQYDKEIIYLTNWKFRAENYARRAFAGGEMGMIAYFLQEMARFVEIDLNSLPNNLKTALDDVRKMGNTAPQPVVFEIKDYDIDNLKLENGKPIPEWMLASFRDKCKSSFRYYGKIELDISSAIKI